jgi:hypothetical protein
MSLILSGSISLDSTGTFKDQQLTHLGDEEEALLAVILHIWRALHDGFHSGQRQQDILGPKELKLFRLLKVMTLN